MNWFQIRIVALLLVLSALDGYDILAVTFAAPSIIAAWGIGKAQLGVVLSSGLAGMAMGGLLLAPLADVVGRKTIFLPSLALMAIGMLLSAGAESFWELAFWRVVTGIGIGACGALLNSFAAEFASADRRPLVISIMVVGFPLGGVVGGVTSSLLLKLFDWPAVFLAGAAAAFVMLPIVAFWLPESPAYLAARPSPRNLSKLNRTLERLGRPVIREPGQVQPPEHRGYAAIFAPKMFGATIWIMLVNGLHVLAVYYVLSWLPQMIVEAGFDASKASLVSALLNLAGVFGGILLGCLSQPGNLRSLTAGGQLAFGAATIAFGFAQPSLPILVGAAAVCGFFLMGSTCGLYASIARTFADEARASGIGFVGGVGRIFSAIAPLMAGQLFAVGFSRAETATVFGLCAIAAGVTVFLGWRTSPSSLEAMRPRASTDSKSTSHPTQALAD